MSFAETLQHHDPSEQFSLTPNRIAELAISHYSEIMTDLRTIDTLPVEELIFNLPPGEPLRVDKPVTVSDIQLHLRGSDNVTPEIGIDVMRDGTNVVFRGTGYEADPELTWEFFSHNRRMVKFHTHPDPSDAVAMRMPSLGDLKPETSQTAILIGSTDGMTLVPHYTDKMPRAAWRDYLVGRGFDERSFEQYGAERAWQDFLDREVGVRFVPWSQLDGAATLPQVAIQLELK